jgi:hypothetical protein
LLICSIFLAALLGRCGLRRSVIVRLATRFRNACRSGTNGLLFVADGGTAFCFRAFVRRTLFCLLFRNAAFGFT